MARRMALRMVVSALLVYVALPVQTRTNTSPADTVFLGRKIFSLDAKDSKCQALAVRGGRATATGRDEQIEKYIGSQTKVARLDGKTAIPALIVTHIDTVGIGWLRTEYEQGRVMGLQA